MKNIEKITNVLLEIKAVEAEIINIKAQQKHVFDNTKTTTLKIETDKTEVENLFKEGSIASLLESHYEFVRNNGFVKNKSKCSSTSTLVETNFNMLQSIKIMRLMLDLKMDQHSELLKQLNELGFKAE